MKTMLAGVAFIATIGTATADTVPASSLQNINGQYGAGTATTTTDANGRSTTVTGPGGGANRATGTFAFNSWYQSNVGGGGTVGITSTYARSGNGSVSFATTSGDSKADLQYYFGANGGYQLNSLSSLTNLSYDFLRSGTSTVDRNLAPVFRLDIAKDGRAAGSLVFENVYQAQQAAPVDSWTTLSATLNSGIFWATNAALGPAFADANGGQKTLQAWIDGNAGSTLSVYGMSMGVGSGWNGTFSGAEDNVAIAFSNGVNRSFNFETTAATAAVPEPASWAMMILGIGMAGGVARYRRRKATLTFA